MSVELGRRASSPTGLRGRPKSVTAAGKIGAPNDLPGASASPTLPLVGGMEGASTDSNDESYPGTLEWRSSRTAVLRSQLLAEEEVSVTSRGN